MRLRAYAFLVATMLLWAANAIAGKLALGHVSPFFLTSARWGISFAAAILLGGRRLAADWPAIRKNWPLFVFYGSFGFAWFNAAFYSAAKYTSAINIVIIQAGMPFVIFCANFMIFRIRVTGGQVFGFLLTIAGVLIVTSNGSLETLAGLGINRGDALMCLAVLLYGGYTVALRFKPQVHWLSFMIVASAIAFVASLPFTLWEIADGGIVWPDLQGTAICLFTALLPGFLAQAAYIRGNELIGGNRAGLFINLVPVFGTLMSVTLLGEDLRLYHVAALALVLAGIGLAERAKPAAMPAK